MAVRLDAVERDTLAVMGHQGGGAIELAVVPTFGTQWLLPRLKRFQRLHPEVTINLTNRTRPFLFADTEFDAALYFGDADWSGTVSHFLMRENPVPVCSPELLGGRRTLSAEQVAGLPLMQQSTRPYAWRQWFHSQGLNVAHDMSGPRYELFSMLAQAAMHGMGVALIPPFLIQDELADGRLIVPSATCLFERECVLPDHSRAQGRIGDAQCLPRLAGGRGQAVPRGQRAGLNAQEHRVAQAGRAALGPGRSAGSRGAAAAIPPGILHDGQDGGRGAPHQEFT